MKILNSDQIRALDAYTIKNEPIPSIDLMERASATFVNWFVETFPRLKKSIHIFCGQGNNGGDGLAVARMLHEKGYTVKAIVCSISENQSNDFKENLTRLQSLNQSIISFLKSADPLPKISKNRIVIDSIFGSGLNRSVEGWLGELIQYINDSDATIISIDVPSGLFSDKSSEGKIIRADYTFSFEFPKLSFLFPQNQDYVGKWIFQSIGLDKAFIKNTKTSNYLIDNQLIKSILKKRKKYDHKGTFGHALIVAGGYGKVGAAILASKACLRSGAGLVSIHAPKCAYQILQISFPEAMVSVDDHEFCVSGIHELSQYKSIGVGCGIGTNELTQKGLKKLIKNAENPLVMDADALNILSQNKGWLNSLPKNSILTPHPKEFERLFGTFEDDFERNDFQKRKSQELGVFIILKGANTAITCPSGDCFFNTTGNPGMATGGSGDVLTGIITGLLAQGYDSQEACLLGVYLHGMAGDIAAETTQQEALLASDIIDAIGKGFKQIREK